MAPTPSPIHVHPSNPLSNRHLRRLRRQVLPFSHFPQGRPSTRRTEQSKPRTLDLALQPSVAPEVPPPPIVPTPSELAMLPPDPSAIPVGDNQPQGPTLPGDISGNTVAAIVVVIVILGGLIGLVVGGEMLRRRARTTGEGASPPTSKCFRPRKSKPIENVTGSPQQHVRTGREKLPYNEKTLNPLARPPHALNKQRQRRLPDIWPIRNLSRVLCNHRLRSEQVERGVERSPPAVSPQTTWSDFSPVSLYVPPPRTVLSRIPEEREEDCQSQTDAAVILNVTLQRSPGPNFMVSVPQTEQPKPLRGMLPAAAGFNGPESSATTERRGSKDCQTTHNAGTRDGDTKSVGSSAPDMTSDGGESSRSSTASLESIESGNNRDSLEEEVFELRRAQTRSMQMNKGVLLSLSLKTLDDSQSFGPTNEEPECSPSRPPSAPGAEGGKEFVERERSLAMFDGSFSAVNLDEFPSPPSILPMIPSLVSGF